MLDLQYSILKKLKDSNGKDYQELISTLIENPNDVHNLLLVLLADNIITSTEDFAKTRSGFISLTSKGVLVVLSEAEYRLKAEAQDKALRKQFKITQLIAVASVVVIVIQILADIIMFRLAL